METVKNIKESVLPKYFKMYSVSGQDELTPSNFQKYLRNKEEQDKKIEDAAKVQIARLVETEVESDISKMIHSASEEERFTLIRQGLENNDIRVQKDAAEMIYCVPEEEQVLLKEIVTQKIKQGLESSDPKIRKIAVKMIERAPLEDMFLLIRQGLENADIEVQRTVAEMNYCVSIKEKALFKEIIAQKIKQGLENVDVKVQKIATEMIGYVSEEKKVLLKEIVTQKIKDTKNDEFRKYIIEGPLYDSKNINSENFSREKFEKTGSDTILIGGNLKDKLIIRVIEPFAFITWQKLFENYQMWKDADFDYVPIEPIMSYSLNKDSLVNVYCGVLDLSLASWLNKTNMFSLELKKQKEKIEKVLIDNQINHGHTHDGNFCLRFFRDENGQPNFNRVPRLYLIDFDESISPAN